MPSFRREKYSAIKIDKTLKQYVSQYCDDYNHVLRIDQQLKIISFLTYLVYAFLKKRVDCDQIIKKFDEIGLIKIYVDMLSNSTSNKANYDDLENIPYLSNQDKQAIANALTFTPELTRLIYDLLIKYRLKVNQTNLNGLIKNVVQFILVNYHVRKFSVYAKDNLSDDYDSKVKFAIITCDGVARIHKLLRELLPTSMDLLVVYLNEIMEKLV
jgi:hypothetical protein